MTDSRGDRIDDVPFSKLEGKGFFTKELEDAQLEGRIASGQGGRGFGKKGGMTCPAPENMAEYPPEKYFAPLLP